MKYNITDGIETPYPGPKIDTIFSPIRQELLSVRKRMKTAMLEAFNPWAGDTGEIIDHLCIPGKMIRPALVILSAKISGGTITEKIIDYSVALELIHTASLIHDDIIDDADTRRGNVSINARYGVKTAVLAGDMIHVTAFKMIDSIFEKEISEHVLECIQFMCGSELLNLYSHVNDTDSYIRLIHNKTASMMSVCCRTGAMLSSNDITIINILSEFGLNFGYAFQIMDDLRDMDIPHRIDRTVLEPLAKNYTGKSRYGIQQLPDSIFRSILEKMTYSILS